MSAVVVFTPVVIAAWPVFSAAVVAAASAMGYSKAQSLLDTEPRKALGARCVDLEMENSSVMTDSLGRDQEISVVKDGVCITFRRDERGKAALTVTGEGRSDDQLRAMGEELSRRVIQRYVYEQIKAEMAKNQYAVIEESVDETNAIHMTVRNWDN